VSRRMSASLSDNWFGEIHALLAHVRDVNRPALARIGELVGPTIARGGVLLTFGSGHSEIIAREIIGRAGGLVCVSGIQEPTSGAAENVPGFGRLLAERHARLYGMERGETVIVISNSGRNAAPIDVALFARERGLNVVAITALAMAREVTSRHPSGKMLPDCADVVLDNGGIAGDARLPLPDHSGTRSGPTSTLTGALLLNLVQLEVLQWLADRGHALPVLRSQNTDGGAEHNQALAAKYRLRLSRPL
jgi:uncharacterized phosphosugar-binding protein